MSRLRRFCWVVAALACQSSLLGSPAHAAHASTGEEKSGIAGARVLLLTASPELERALHTALAPWETLVESVPPGPLDTHALARSPDEMADVAGELRATVLVWLVQNAQGSELHWFDAVERSHSTRAVPPQRLDATLAAALALSIKTRLRAPGAALSKRTDSPTAPVVPKAAPSASANVAEAEAERASAPAWLAVAHAGMRGAALEPNATELRYGAELRWTPWPVPPEAMTAPWLGLRIELGTQSSVRAANFRGDYSEANASAAAGVTRRLSQRLSAGLQVAAALQRGQLVGTPLPGNVPASESRWGWSLGARTEMGVSLGAISVLVQPALGVTPLRQSYRVDGIEVLQTRPVWWMIGAALGVALD